MGINWKCGQEIAFRSFAWIFGLYAFLDSEHTTDDRICTLIKALYYNALRVEGNINFAIKAVQNNHAISEAACLFTVGTLFPFMKNSRRFKVKGKRYLEQEGLKQIYEDGSYIQGSMNYHRLMLQVYTWVWQLAQINGVSFSNDLKNRLKNATGFLYQMQDETSGRVPNYGANDGALVFPLSSCDYLDYRPQLNTINYVINGTKLYERGKHEEDLMWFCGLEVVGNSRTKSIAKTSSRFDYGGYYTIRGEESFGMVRCARIRHRAGSADSLHFDLWYKGINILSDIGSYSYNPEAQFKGYFGATRNHNTITVNDMNQTKNGPRFLSLDGSEGFLNDFSVEESKVFFSGYHTGYGEFTHTRKIELQDNRYIITDEIENPTGQEIKLNWNVGTDCEQLKPNKYHLTNNGKKLAALELSSLSSGNVQIYFGDEEMPAGWKSLYYGEKTPVYQLVYEVRSNRNKEVIKTVIDV